MKYLALEYMKNMNQASYDVNQSHLADDIMILNAASQQCYDNYSTYLAAHRNQLEKSTFSVIRCDDFEDIAIVLAEVKSEQKTIYDYIGYFLTSESKIRRIDEYWCERKES